MRQLKRDIAKLKGVGTKRETAKRVAKMVSKDVGRVGWKGLKVAGKFVKNVLEAEAREQARERQMSRPKTRPKTKRKRK